MESIVTLFLLALLGSILALVGGVVFLFSKSLSKTLETYSVPFAAGVLVTVSLLGLMPEAVEAIGENAFLIILLSFFGAYLFENVFFGIHHHGEDKTVAIPLVIIGDTIHNFIDGIAIGASFLITPGLGLITALSTFLHEVPHEIGDFGLMLKMGWKRANIIVVNVISASLTILGAFLVYFMSDDSFTGYFLAVSAGIFLYLGASDFLPLIKRESRGRFKAVVPLLLGIIVMAAVILLIPHVD